MAIYHLEAKVISRGIGRSAAAASAYMSCSRIYNDYDGIQHDYTKKQGLVYEQILLPPQALPEWKNRSVLWNAVEAAEKSKDSRLARELVVALPIELDKEAWVSLLTEYVENNFVNDGMCADFCIHDTDGHNPHSHIMLTVRPLAENGKWQSKTEKEYLCVGDGEERGFTSSEFKTVQADGWEKQYQYFVGKKKVYMAPSEAEKQGLERASKYPKSARYGRQNPTSERWNSEEQLLVWRENWSDVNNRYLEKRNVQSRIDHRSYKERGIDEQPTIHEGVNARIIEKQGHTSERCEINRQIKADNMVLRKLKEQVQRLTDTVKKSASAIAEVLENIRNRLIVIQYQMNFNTARSEELSKENTVIDLLLKRYQGIIKDIKTKTVQRKKLQSEKNRLGSLHIIRHNKLSAQIAALTENIEELKNQKNIVLNDMRCENDKQVSGIEERRNNNVNLIERLDKRNTALLKEKETAKSDFVQIRSGVAPKDIDSVQAERDHIRSNSEKSILARLQKVYGMKYSYQDFKAAVKTVCNELDEIPLLRKSVRKQLQQNQGKVDLVNKKNTREPER